MKHHFISRGHLETLFQTKLFQWKDLKISIHQDEWEINQEGISHVWDHQSRWNTSCKWKQEIDEIENDGKRIKWRTISNSLFFLFVLTGKIMCGFFQKSSFSFFFIFQKTKIFEKHFLKNRITHFWQKLFFDWQLFSGVYSIF